MLTCACWVKRGIAKEVPDKVLLTEDDLQTLLDKSGDKIKEVIGEDISAEEVWEEKNLERNENVEEYNEKMIEEEVGLNLNEDEIVDYYNLQDYDEEGAVMTGAGMAGLMYYNKTAEDPYVDLGAMNEDDREDDHIKIDDNLIVVGKIEEDSSCLEIYVYNESEDSLYVHHDILLESFPLCLEWLSFDPGSSNKPGNLMAIGTMEPDIEVWDLDVINTIEPAVVLKGCKKKKTSKKEKLEQKLGHSDAVLCLSWNHNSVNVLASGSADKTVLLWDLNQGSPVYELKHHTDKVQAAMWHPLEVQSLLTGSFDKTVAVVDCRTPNKGCKSLKINGECEQVSWDHFSPYNFLACTDEGNVHYFDIRNEKSIFTLHAHDEAITGMSLSRHYAHHLTTVSSDKQLKVWDFNNEKPVCVMSRDMKMGNLHFVCACPDAGNVFAVGGKNEGLRLFNIYETAQGKQYLKSKENREDRTISTNGGGEQEKQKLNAETASDALSSLSLKNDPTKVTKIVKKKKKKNKKK